MTKLEQKLSELGYTTNELIKNAYWKKVKRDMYIKMLFNHNHKEIVNFYIDCIITTQKDMNDLQQAFNEMQKDLEILKECER